MGQGSSSNEEAKKAIEPQAPSFVQVLQMRAVDAKAKNKSAVEVSLDAIFSNEAKINDVKLCVDHLVAFVLAQADKGIRSIDEVRKSPLLLEAWIIHKNDIYASTYLDKEEAHFCAIRREFADRTGLKSFHNDKDRLFRDGSAPRFLISRSNEGYGNFSIKIIF